MKRLAFIVTIAVVGLVGLSALPRSTSATTPEKLWPPLSETCNDVSGDGYVDLGNDILAVILHYGTSWGGPPNAQGFDYALLYDVSGGGFVDLGNDILGVVQSYDQQCSLVDTQVVAATVAVMKYQDQNVAIADGFMQGTQNIAGHGIHWVHWGRVLDEVFDPALPEGLNYSTDGELLAVYYIDPMWMAGHEQPPPGFDGDEAMWHDHPRSCAWQGPTGPMFAENVDEAVCLARPGGVWFESFGWMLHLWNFFANTEGRFNMHNPSAG